MIKRLIWVIAFKASATDPQTETVRYTAEAANKFATAIQDNGGVAMVFESDEDVDEDDPSIPHNRSALVWPQQ